jgi:CMP-N,N'-diacetyllegionaminic acid synthase
LKPSAVALVPARAGSERVPGKNVRELAGHPLIAYSIAAARESGVFGAIVVSTDSEKIAEVARRYGAEVMAGRDEEIFGILRPTSPFRSAGTIRRAFERLVELGDRADSIRAVELVRQHPGKMWVLEGDLMRPFADQPAEGVPFHSMQYQALPQVYVQNSSLELAWSRVLDGEPSIAGERVAPFLTDGLDGLTIDYPQDFERAERLVATGEAVLPRIEIAA